MAYRDKGDGTQDRRPFHLYGYMFLVDSNRSARSLTLPKNPLLEVLALTLAPPATMVDLSSNFNHANGLVADGSRFAFKADKEAREAFEIYIAGRFGPTITNTEIFNQISSISRGQRIVAQQIMARRNAPTDLDFKRAAAVVEPNLKVPAVVGPEFAVRMLSQPLFLYSAFLLFGALPACLAALFRGGLILRMLGVAVVKNDGAEASGLRMLWRSFLAWVPLLVVGLMAQWLFPAAGLAPAESFLLNFISVILAFSLMICAAVWPKRGLHDRLAGTCLVPRD